MRKLTAILVEDLPLALQMLYDDIINHHPEIQIIGTATSVVEASKLLQKKQPDILFLDIMLGDGTGFDILEIIPHLHSKIIFVTASDEFAIKAFKFAAIDYILKPYTIEDLALAITKARNQIAPENEQLAVLKERINNSEQPKKISLATSDKIVIVGLDEIIRCESDNNYTTFYLENNTNVLVSKTLKFYADLLADHHFLRVHQSHLVNKKFIKAFIKSDGGYLVLTNKKTIPVAVRKRSEVLEALNTF